MFIQLEQCNYYRGWPFVDSSCDCQAASSTHPTSQERFLGVPNRTIAQRMKTSTLHFHSINNHVSLKCLQWYRHLLNHSTCIRGTCRRTLACHLPRIQPLFSVCDRNIPVNSRLNIKQCHVQSPGRPRTIGMRQFRTPSPPLSPPSPVPPVPPLKGPLSSQPSLLSSPSEEYLVPCPHASFL